MNPDKVGPLGTEFYSGQDKHTTADTQQQTWTVCNPRSAQSQLWPTIISLSPVLGIGSILHIGLIIYLLVVIPGPNLFPVYFVLSALWGICDAIWQTQCNCMYTKLKIYHLLF